MKRPGIAFFVAVMTIQISVQAMGQTRVALVIGNGAYPSGPLVSPRFDEKAVATELKNLGFLVTEKVDLTRADMLRAIANFGEILRQPQTVGLFYYSGHGIQINNRNYLIPVDAVISTEPDVDLFGVPVDNILRRMEIANSNPNIVILDACRDNPFEKRYKSITRGSGLAPENPVPGTLIAYAAAPGHTAEPGLNGQLSAYTRGLVDVIHIPGQDDLVRTFQKIQNAVYHGTQGRQQPYVEFSPGLPEFVLNRGLQIAPSVIPAPDTATPEVDLAANIGGRIFFSRLSSEITPEARATLDRIADWLSKHPNGKVRVAGGADDREGSEDTALGLGTSRWHAVVKYLTNKGVGANRMTGVSFGRERPIAVGEDETTQAQNRRVEVTIQ